MSKKIFKFILSLALLLPMLTAYSPMELMGASVVVLSEEGEPGDPGGGTGEPDPVLPVPIVTGSASEITHNSALISINVTTNGATLTGLSIGGTGLNTATTSHVVTGLIPNTTNTVEIRANFSYNSTPLDTVVHNVSVQTGPDPDAIVVPTFSIAQNPFTNSAATSVTYTINVTNIGNPRPTHHGVVWATSANNAFVGNANAINHIQAAVPANWNPSGTETHNITGLQTGRAYHFRAFVRLSDNTVIHDNAVTRTFTPPQATTAPAFNIAANPFANITSNSATYTINLSNVGTPRSARHGIVWSTTPAGANVGNANALGTSEANVPAAWNPSGNTTHSITSLQPNTTYHVRAFVRQNNVVVHDTITRTFTTTAGTTTGVTFGSMAQANAVPTNRIFSTGADVIVNFSNFGTPRGTHRGVVITTSSVQNSDSGLRNGQNNVERRLDQQIAANAQTGNFPFVLTGLQPNTTYWVRGYVRHQANGTVTYDSQIRTFTTQTGTGAAFGSLTNANAIRSVTATGATVRINISNIGTPRSTHRGVVWTTSTTNNTDSLLRHGQSGVTRVEQTVPASGTVTGDFDFNITGRQPNTRHWVRGYVRSGNNVTYDSQIREFTTSAGSGHSLTSAAAANLAVNSASVVINITNLGNGITGHGVVWSTNSNNLTVNASGSNHVISDQNLTGTGNRTHILRNLQPNTTYHYRGFVRHGTGNNVTFVYDTNTRQFTTPSANNLAQATTGNAVRVSATSIDVPITISDPTASTAQNQRATERGVVFSSTVSDPRLGENDVQVQRSGSGTGSVTVTLSSLTSGGRYFVRAYSINANGVSYGNVVEIVAQNVNRSVTVELRTEEGWRISRQTINSNAGATINANSLTMPAGYVIVGNFSYTVTATSTNVNATVRRAQQGPYLESASGFRFEPERPITRIEVARMIHALRGNANAGTGMQFADMPTDPADLAALRFVSEMGFMVGDESGGAFRSFRPHATISRAEVVTILSNVYGLQTGFVSSFPFTDVASDRWYTTYVAAAYRHQMLVGFPDGTFRPANNMTRAEALAVFARAEGIYNNPQPLGTAQFSDVPFDHWARNLIHSAAIPRP